METARVKSGIKNFLAYFAVFLTAILLFSCFVFLIIRNTYKNWERDFVNSGVIVLNLEGELFSIEQSLNEKIVEYNMVKTEYSFIQLTQEESILLFSRALNDSLPSSVRIYQMGLVPSQGSWYLYGKGRFRNFDLPWIGLHLKKEAGQSVDLYIEDVFLGNLSFKGLFLGSFVEDVNSGINRSIWLVNDGNFAGRIFENIELTEDYLVIRSRNIY